MGEPRPKGLNFEPYNLRQLEASVRRIGYEFHYLPETTSTMDVARSYTDRSTVVLTDHQTLGRGRFGRRWYDEPGGAVLMTVTEPFSEDGYDPLPTSPLPSQIFALAAVQALRRITHNREIQLCWPNDLVVAVAPGSSERKKMGGILVESPDRAPNDTRPYSKLFGIGINVHALSTQIESDYPIVSLDELSSKPIQRDSAIIALLRAWSHMRVDMRAMRNQRVFDHYTKLWQQCSFLLQSPNRVVRVNGIGADTAQSIEGRVVDSPLNGGLILDTASGVVEVNEYHPNTKLEVLQ